MRVKVIAVDGNVPSQELMSQAEINHYESFIGDEFDVIEHDDNPNNESVKLPIPNLNGSSNTTWWYPSEYEVIEE